VRGGGGGGVLGGGGGGGGGGVDVSSRVTLLVGEEAENLVALCQRKMNAGDLTHLLHAGGVQIFKSLLITKFTMYAPPPNSIWSTEILFENFQKFHKILFNFANFRGGAR